MQKLQDRFSGSAAHCQQQNACRRAHQCRGMDRIRKSLPVTGTEVVGCQHIDAAGKANEKAGEEHHQDRGGTYGAQCNGARKAPHHRHVRHIE